MVTTALRNCLLPCLLALALPLTAVTADRGKISVSGTVTDSLGQSVPGATVLVLADDSIVTGASSDDEGRFSIRYSPTAAASRTLRVSSVGYETQTVALPIAGNASDLVIHLQESLADVATIRVTPSMPIRTPGQIGYSTIQVTSQANRSLVPTNPIAAIKQPQVARVGSEHSSQLRIHGTNPVYYLNGLPIGTDPAHYGMFAVIPAPAIETITLRPQGTPARYQIPSVVEMTTSAPFDTALETDMTLSTIDATGTFRTGNSRFCVNGALRKSVLDKLVNQLDVTTNRRTLPPTNFQDVYASAGIKLSPTANLMIDRFQVRDFLSYNSAGATGSRSGIDTRQESHESHTAVRLNALFNGIYVKGAVAVRNEQRTYQALPNGASPSGSIKIDLDESVRTTSAGVEATIDALNANWTAGFQSTYDSDRSFSMEQRNWNFLPPFATSDQPYIYQTALNSLYGEYSADASGSVVSPYVSVSTESDRLRLELGGRVDHYSRLERSTMPSVRMQTTWRLGEQSRAGLFLGTFSESPVSTILEPYQVLIRANLARLSPIRTQLASVDFTRGPLTVNVFGKRICDQPAVTPDFSAYDSKSHTFGPEFITVRSSGYSRFVGTSVAIDKDDLLDGRLDMYLGYAYTHARRVDNGVIMNYELNSPHRFMSSFDFTASKHWTFGTEFQIRSGYSFSPLPTPPPVDQQKYYSYEYYSGVLSQENTLRFPTYASLNLSATYSTDRLDVFLSVSNVTNRANPMISSAAGLVYDAGIMPMLGVTVRM